MLPAFLHSSSVRSLVFGAGVGGGGAGFGLAGGEGLGGFVVKSLDGEVFALRLAGRFVFGASDVDVDRHGDFGVQMQRHRVDADGLDRVGEGHLAAGDGVAVGAQRLGDVARADRAVELAGLTRLADDDDGLAVEAGSDAGGGFAALGIALFDRGALALELLAVGFGGAQRLVLRQQIIAGVAVLDGDFVADVAVLADALEQNDFRL